MDDRNKLPNTTVSVNTLNSFKNILGNYRYTKERDECNVGFKGAALSGLTGIFRFPSFSYVLQTRMF